MRNTRKLTGPVAVATGAALAFAGITPAGAQAAPAADPAAASAPAVAIAPAPAAAGEFSIRSSGPFSAYAPVGGKYGAESKSNTAILGNYNTYVYYSWSVQPGSNSTACVDGWVPWGKDPKVGTWYSLGCGKKGGGKGILWGSYAAVPKVRAKAGGLLTGSVIQWFH